MYPFSPKLPFHPGCHITLSRVPCAIQQDLVGYPFWIYQSVHVPPKLPNYPFLASLLAGNHEVLLCFFSVNKLICIVSFYSKHICDIIQYFSLSDLLDSVWEFLGFLFFYFFNCYKLYSCMFYIFLFCVKFGLGWGVFSV